MNFTSYPRQDAFETTLATDIDAVVTTIGLNLAPSFALSSGTCYAVIDYDKPTTKIEIISFTGVSGSNLTGVIRGVAKYEGGASTAQTHGSGAKVIISDNWQTFKDIATAINTKLDLGGGTITGPVDFSGGTATFRLPNLTQAEINALTTQNGFKVYNTTTGKEQICKGGNWYDLDIGGSIPNASQTVAGIVEEATQAEFNASTDTGGTGARLFVPPSVIQTAIAGTANPAGVMLMYAGVTAPTGYLFCDGASLLRASYAALFTAIGTTYGSADGTHFNLPDFRGRTPVGVGTGTGGGASGTGLPVGGSPLTAVALGTWKGEETHILTTPEIPSHSHTNYTNGGVESPSRKAFSSTTAYYMNAQLSTDAAGGGGSHNNIQPVMGVNFIIKT